MKKQENKRDRIRASVMSFLADVVAKLMVELVKRWFDKD